VKAAPTQAGGAALGGARIAPCEIPPSETMRFKLSEN
jgi:hypothetical protein